MTLNSIRQHNQTVLDSLEEGDLVEFPRGLYSHWAVYVGNEDIVHLTGDINFSCTVDTKSSCFSICGKQFTKAEVKLHTFFDATANCKVKKNNDMDKMVRPLDKQTIVLRAKSKIGKIGYNILWYNCECFARWCRYGECWSEQTNTALQVAEVIAAVVVGVAVLLFGIFIYRKIKK